MSDDHRPLPPMWVVEASQSHMVHVRAANWLDALAQALPRLGVNPGVISRLACEQLPNGTAIINALDRNLRLVVRQEHNPNARPPVRGWDGQNRRRPGRDRRGDRRAVVVDRRQAC